MATYLQTYQTSTNSVQHNILCIAVQTQPSPVPSSNPIKQTYLGWAAGDFPFWFPSVCPQLRACLTMQILAIAASGFSMILMLGHFEGGNLRGCWYDYDNENRNETSNQQIVCEQLMASSTVSHSSSFTFNAVGNIGNIVSKSEVG